MLTARLEPGAIDRQWDMTALCPPSTCTAQHNTAPTSHPSGNGTTTRAIATPTANSLAPSSSVEVVGYVPLRSRCLHRVRSGCIAIYSVLRRDTKLPLFCLCGCHWWCTPNTLYTKCGSTPCYASGSCATQIILACGSLQAHVECLSYLHTPYIQQWIFLIATP